MMALCRLTHAVPLCCILIGALYPTAAGAADPPMRPPAADHPVLQWGPVPKGWTPRWSGNYRKLMKYEQEEAPRQGSAAMPLGSLIGFGGSILVKEVPRLQWRSVQYAGLGVSLRHHPGLSDLDSFRELMAEEAGKKGVSRQKLEAKFQFTQTRFQNFRAFRMAGSDRLNLRDLQLVEVAPGKGLWAWVDGYYSLSDYDLENPSRPLDLSSCRAQFAAGLEQIVRSLSFGDSLALSLENHPNQPLLLQLRLALSSPGKTPAELRKLLAQKLQALKSPRFRVHLFDRHHNTLKLQDDFKSNGEWDSRLRHLKPAAPPTPGLEAADDPSRSLPVPVKITPEHTGTIEAFLCFQRLARYSRTHGAAGVRVPSFDAPLTVRIEAELVSLDAKGEDVVIASATRDVLLDHIARVEGSRYETPALQGAEGLLGRGQVIESASGPLQDYGKPPHGDPLGLQRLKVQRKSGPAVGTIAMPGEFPGTLLLRDEVLRVADRVRIDATRMTAHGVVGAEPPQRVRPGLIALRLRFLDGTLSEIRVREDAGTYDVVLGASTSDYRPAGMAWAYFSADFSKGQAVDKAVEFAAEKLLPHLAPGIGLVNTAKDFYEVMQFGNGPSTQQVRLNSRVFGAHHSGGRLELTTLQGAPVIFHATRCPRGLPVPSGKTAVVAPDAAPLVRDTDRATRDRALAALGGGTSRPMADWLGSPPAWLWKGGIVLALLVAALAFAGLGLVVARRTPAAGNERRFCSRCGARRTGPSGARYCGACGAAFGA